MARSLYDLDDRQPAGASDWLNEKQDRRTRLLPAGILLIAIAVATGATLLIRQALPASDTAKPMTETTEIEQIFALCDNPKGDACVLSADSYAWRGHRYHLSDISVPSHVAARCAQEAELARKGRILLAVMLNGGAFKARPDAADTDPDARILTRDGVSLGQLMVLKGHARPWSPRPSDWCRARP